MKDPILHEIRKGRFSLLLRRFDHEYGDACDRLAGELERSCPEATRKGRRTGRALRNICFFVWSWARDGDERLIPALFKASVLLSALDDYYDNRRIPAAQKKAFCSAIDRFLESRSFAPGTADSRQTRDLAALWSAVARPIRSAPPAVHSYWKGKARRLNVAMEAENRLVRSATLTLDEYLHAAVHSIGMVFIWSTYLVHKGVPPNTMHALDAVTLLGARIARLSNDIASYRQGKRTNAVILLGGGKAAEARVVRLIGRESRIFRERLDGLDVGPDVKRVLLRSTEFLRELYRRSDFDQRTLM
jgi:hypothetical protein